MSQTERLYEFLKDGKPQQPDSILMKAYDLAHHRIAMIDALNRINDSSGRSRRDAEY
jgi:hypothetical protein